MHDIDGVDEAHCSLGGGNDEGVVAVAFGDFGVCRSFVRMMVRMMVVVVVVERKGGK